MTKNKPLNHKLLGGDVVEHKREFPQRKPEKHQSGEELLNKAVYGTPKAPSADDKRNKEWSKILEV